MATWADPTHSIERRPWVKGADGAWARASNPDSSGHENTWYEDKFAIQWNINSPTFATQGCAASCHPTGDPASPGRKSNPDGELTDMWHWKSVRTEPNGQLDDKHISYLDSGDCSGENCRLADSKESGGYADNHHGQFGADCAGDPDGVLALPCFMGPEGAERMTDDVSWIYDDEKQPFEDSFASDDRIAGMITSAFVGSCGDVETAARYDDGEWTLEIARSRATAAGEAEDVQFTDETAEYAFGLAVFDNTQINHAATGGPFLMFLGERSGEPPLSGPSLYLAQCAMCHGTDGVALEGAAGSGDFDDPAWQDENSQAEIEGVGAMSGYSGLLTADEIEAVAAHVKSLGEGS
ncbi:MAG: hypothetical protein GY898_04485 [Proteobacteria bacterium]|nr:hypothetical protein [Pseudomonadota bacterium]